MMEEGEQTVHGPGGVEVVISFLPNNEILVRVPPTCVVRTETLEVELPSSCFGIYPSRSEMQNGGVMKMARRLMAEEFARK